MPVLIMCFSLFKTAIPHQKLVMTLLEPLLQHILELQMLLVLQDMMDLLPQPKFNVRLVVVGQLLQDAPSKVKNCMPHKINKLITKAIFQGVHLYVCPSVHLPLAISYVDYSYFFNIIK